MAENLPAPLIGSEVDLRNMDGFMMNVERLMASELWALSTGEEFKAAFALWCRAWKQLPAGSLPDDDKTLAAFSGAGKRWKIVKEVSTRGFIKCSDGRLYHPVLCEDAERAWKAKQQRKEAISKRWSKDRPNGRNSDETPPNDARTYGSDTTVLRENYQGQGHRQGESIPTLSTENSAVVDLTDQIWEIAGQSPDAYRVAGKIEDQRLVRGWLAEGFTREQILASAKAIIGRSREIRSLWRLLETSMPEELAKQKAEDDRPIDDGNGLWRKRVGKWVETKGDFWLDRWGDPPDHPRTEVPPIVLDEFGIVPAVQGAAQ